MTESVFGGAATILGYDENCDNDRKHTSEGYEDGNGLIESQYTEREGVVNNRNVVSESQKDRSLWEQSQGKRRTSRIGSHLLPSAEIALHSNVIATNSSHVSQTVAFQIGSPLAFVKTLIQPMKRSVVPKLTDRVIVMLPRRYAQPQIHAMMLRHQGGLSI